MITASWSATSQNIVRHTVLGIVGLVVIPSPHLYLARVRRRRRYWRRYVGGQPRSENETMATKRKKKATTKGPHCKRVSNGKGGKRSMCFAAKGKIQDSRRHRYRPVHGGPQ